MKPVTAMWIAVLAGLLWSFHGVVIRFITEATAWQILFYRSIALVICLMVWLWLSKRMSPVATLRRVSVNGAVAAMGLCMAFSGGVYAYTNTLIATAGLIFAASPFLAALLAWAILGEKPHLRTWMAIALAFTGIGVMIGGSLGLGRLDGNIAALISAFGFAVFAVFLRRGMAENMLVGVCHAGVLTMVVSGALALTMDGGLAIPSHDIALAMLMGVFLLGAGLILTTVASRHIPAAELTLLSTLTEILLAPVWAWLLIGETFGLPTLAGGALVLAAIGINTSRRRAVTIAP